jgi:hypothetical protein
MFHNEDYDLYTGLRRLTEDVRIHDIPRDERIDIAKAGFIPPFAALIACACQLDLHMHDQIKTGVIKGLYRYQQSLCGCGGDVDALLDEFIWEPEEDVCFEQQSWFEELLQMVRGDAGFKRWQLWRFESEVAKAIEVYLVARGEGLMTKSAVEIAVSTDVIDAMYEAHAWLRKHYPERLESNPKAAAAA